MEDFLATFDTLRIEVQDANTAHKAHCDNWEYSDRNEQFMFTNKCYCDECDGFSSRRYSQRLLRSLLVCWMGWRGAERYRVMAEFNKGFLAQEVLTRRSVAGHAVEED